MAAPPAPSLSTRTDRRPHGSLQKDSRGQQFSPFATHKSSPASVWLRIDLSPPEGQRR